MLSGTCLLSQRAVNEEPRQQDRQIRHYVSREAVRLRQLATSLVLFRLDYCNSVLVGLPASPLIPCTSACQNAAARLVLGLHRRSHTTATAALQDLHWLPVKHRITFKIASLMHQVLHSSQRCPTYLSDLVEFNSVGTQHSDFVRQLPELLSFDEPRLSSDGGPSLFVVLQTFGTLFPQLFSPQTRSILLSGVR